MEQYTRGSTGMMSNVVRASSGGRMDRFFPPDISIFGYCIINYIYNPCGVVGVMGGLGVLCVGE
jgi:hypothetical protein